MLRVTVEIVRHGDEGQVEVVGTVLIAQVEKHDKDPDGWRGYAAWAEARTRDDIQGRGPDAELDHKRDAGAMALAGSTLAALWPGAGTVHVLPAARRLRRRSRRTQ